MRILSRVAILSVVGVCFSNAALAADLFTPFPEPEPTRKSSWTGFFLGGGLGLQKLDTDIDIDSRTSSESADYHKCLDANGNHVKYDGDLSGKNKFINFGDDAKAKFDFALNCLENHENRILQHDWLKHYESEVNFSTNKEVESDWTVFGTVMAGYDYQVSNRVVVGAFVDLDFGSVDVNFDHHHNAIPVGDYWGKNGKYASNDDFAQDVSISGDLEKDFAFTLGGRIGYLLENEKTLGYVLAGYTRASMDGHIDLDISGTLGDFNNKHSYDYVPIAASQSISDNINGFTIGAGAEHRINNKWSARVEYRYTWFEDIEASFSETRFSNDSEITGGGKNVWARSTTTQTDVDIDPSLHSIRAVLSYKFHDKGVLDFLK